MRGSGRRSAPSTSPTLTATMILSSGGEHRRETGSHLIGEILGEPDLRVTRGPDIGEALREAVEACAGGRGALSDHRGPVEACQRIGQRPADDDGTRRAVLRIDD